ncbi:MAG: hypothetical protein RRB13_11060 [bacterium]|nr:hypothetical protein [bacterium]
MVKLIVICPPEAQEQLLSVLAEAGLGQLGVYDSWSLASPVTETFRPLPGAEPHEGVIGQRTQVANRRLEFQCPDERWPEMVELICANHPYQSPAIEVIPLLYP